LGVHERFAGAARSPQILSVGNVLKSKVKSVNIDIIPSV